MKTKAAKNTVKIKNINKAQFGGWVNGTVNEFTFCAKLFDEGSDYGINEGRISILEIRNSNNQVVLNYSRGWDTTEPTAQDSIYSAYTFLVKTLENLNK